MNIRKARSLIHILTLLYSIARMHVFVLLGLGTGSQRCAHFCEFGSEANRNARFTQPLVELKGECVEI